MCAQEKRPPEDAVADAVVTHVARDRRRYALRLSGAAACSQQLRSSRSPGASAIFDLHTLWRASASENPDPSVIARTQFVTAFRARLSGGPRRAADALYSSLDPRLADRCRVGAATASLLFAHPVWPVDGRDADYSQEERDVLSAVRAAAAVSRGGAAGAPRRRRGRLRGDARGRGVRRRRGGARALRRAPRGALLRAAEVAAVLTKMNSCLTD